MVCYNWSGFLSLNIKVMETQLLLLEKGAWSRYQRLHPLQLLRLTTARATARLPIATSLTLKRP